VSRAKLILAVDQGTTNTKALLIDSAGAVRARAECPVSISFPRPGWVEQDPTELWNSAISAATSCLEQAGDCELAAVGISNQRESVVVWERRTGKPVGPCIVWQCRRTSAVCENLRREGVEECIRRRSGLPLDPLFSASKIRWLLENVTDGRQRAADGELCAGTVDSWLLWNLTSGGVHATDMSNASRTQLLSLSGCDWDAELTRVFDIPAGCLPKVHASTGYFGVTSRHGLLPAGVPIGSLIGDSHAALFGHAAFAPGSVKATYGTGSSIMAPIEKPLESRHGLATTVAWASPDGVRYALEGNITNTGGAVQWTADLLGLSGGSKEAAALADSVPDSGGVYLVPAFAGLGAPHWDAGARGVLCGLTRGASPAHVARAAVDSIAYQVCDVLNAVKEDSGIPLPALFADGGASRNERLMQFQADLAQCQVIRSSSAELSAVGAAWLAGLAVGYWDSLDALAALPRTTIRFEPKMPASTRQELLDGWRDALQRSRMPRSRMQPG
jgi:glycerol kinase